jgi:hypothetical protein
VRGCLKTVVLLVVLALVAAVGYLNRDRIFGALGRERGSATAGETASQEIADAADAKLDALRSGKTRQVALTEIELQSLLLFKYRGLLPAFVDSPRIQIEGEQLRLRARVPVDRLPQLSELGEAAAFLPDTTELAVAGRLLPLDHGRAALTVDEVSAARIPLPKRLVPGALRRLGRVDEAGLGENAFAVRLPPGVEAAYVRGDSLFLLSNTR